MPNYACPQKTENQHSNPALVTGANPRHEAGLLPAHEFPGYQRRVCSAPSTGLICKTINEAWGQKQMSPQRAPPCPSSCRPPSAQLPLLPGTSLSHQQAATPKMCKHICLHLSLKSKPPLIKRHYSPGLTGAKEINGFGGAVRVKIPLQWQKLNASNVAGGRGV